MSGMTCRRVGDAILDVGRGVPVPSPLARDLEEHVASCGACRAELQRQQELTSGLRALAARTPEWTAPAAMEADLLRQFAARQEGRSVAAAAVPGAADRRIGALRSR